MSNVKKQHRDGLSSACKRGQCEGKDVTGPCRGTYNVNHGMKLCCTCSCHKKNKMVKK